MVRDTFGNHKTPMGPQKALGAGGVDSVTRSGNEERTGEGEGRGGKEMGSLECQAEGVGLCLLTLFLASFIIDSKASEGPSLCTQRTDAATGRGREQAHASFRTALSGMANITYSR